MSLPRSYIISIPDKVKKVPLPPISAWDRVLDASPSSVVACVAKVDIVNYKRLFFGGVDIGPADCIISSDGYIVIYKDESALDGYAFDLTRAKSMRVKEEIDFRGKTKKMKVAIKWTFGKLTLSLCNYRKPAEQILREAFLKPNATSPFRVDVSREPEPTPEDYDDAPMEEDKANESISTVAIPYTIAIPLGEDMVEVTISGSDEQIGAILASIVSTEDGFTFGLYDGN